MTTKIETFPAPAEPLYICHDDEGNPFVYLGPDTFSRLPEGPLRDHWMSKLADNKVTISEVAGTEIVDLRTGVRTLKISDDWEVSPT